jgi:hypothetical protein
MTIMTVRETAAYLGLTKSTLDGWRCRGAGPIFLKLGKAVRYRVEDLDAFVAANVRTSTSSSSAADPRKPVRRGRASK